MYLDWEIRPEDYYVIDIETDDLNATKIWCMCWRNLRTDEQGECTSVQEIKEFFHKTSGSFYIGHNLLGFDGPTLVRLTGCGPDSFNSVDSLVLSTLYSPSLEGGHSLGVWGQRLGKDKLEFEDFEGGLTPKMLEYCHRDVEVTAILYKRLVKTLNGIGFSERSVWLQHHLQEIINQQRKNGFKFDGPRALSLYSQLRSREEELQDEIRRVFPAERVKVACRPMYKKDGSPTSIFLRDSDRYFIESDNRTGVYYAFEDVEFNIGSPKQRVERILQHGWEPEEFTPSGNPKPFDGGELSPSLARFLKETPVPEIELIAKWMAINGRANMINTWLENWNEDTGCIHGKLFVANTLRFRHQSPNTANIPAVRIGDDDSPLLGEDGYFTYEARDLWVARPGRILVGTDAAGLELRMLAHYLNREGFTKQVLEGDPHQYNADVVGITRPQAKTLLYAIMYGAAAPKIAKTLKVSVKEGGRIRTQFLERLGLKDLIEQCQEEQERGRIELIDGSQVICPSPHAALNYKLQGGGARVMGLSSVLADREVKRNGWDVLKVGDIHDEDQSDCDPIIADDFGRMRVNSIREAGERLNMNLPLDGEYKKGLSWAKTH